jgi:hypothetical protein
MRGTLVHPYTDLTGRWFRGSFHGHCSESSGCASVPLHDSVRWYAAAGADFSAVTDHDRVTPLAEMRRMYPGLVLLEGFEYSSCENMLFAGGRVGELYRFPLSQALRRRGEDVLTVVCHPRPSADGREYWTLGKLIALGSLPDGIEIYNGHYGTPTARSHGRQPLGTGLWDEVLGAGHRLWGYANDDSHDPEDLGNAWNMVCAGERTADAIVRAARAGRTYATTGLLLHGLGVAGRHLRIELTAPAGGRFIGPGGAVLWEGIGTVFEYEVRTEAHVRFEAEGTAGRIFLQPVFGA